MKVLKDKGVEGKVIVCTGAAGVLCSSMTEDLLRHGAKVALLGRTREKLDALAKKLAKKGLTATLVCEADVLTNADDAPGAYTLVCRDRASGLSVTRKVW